MFSLDQYTAAREGAALIDRTAQGKISLTGADRASFLHGLLTNDIARLKPGTGVYAAYLTPQGRMISDMRVVENGAEMLLDVDPSVADSLTARLDTLIFSEDVQVKNVTHDLAELGIHGPQAAKTLESALGIPVARLQSLSQYDNVNAPGSGVTVVRDDALGVIGFDVYAPAREGEPLFAGLAAAGAVRITQETAEALRIEAGRPKFALDMDTDTIPLEAGIEDRAISMTKGCYVGQEVIVRILHRGHGRVARKLVWLDINGRGIPSSGDPILAAGQEIGHVTSAAFSPRANALLALGYVQRDFAAGGADVTVQSGGRALQARVRQLVK